MAKVATKTIDEAKLTVTFKFSNGETIPVDVREFPDPIADRLLLHGVAQKIGDSYASAPDVASAINAAKETISNLLSGNWTAGRTSSGVNLLVEALARATGRDLVECIETLAGMDEDAQKALRKHPAIKAAMDAIRAERSAAVKATAADLSDLFA